MILHVTFAHYTIVFLKQILSALFCVFCMIDMTVCDWLSQQAFVYRNKGRIQDLYSRSKLSCSTLRLRRRRSWKIRLFALVMMSLQCSFQFRCGLMVTLKNLLVFASSICFVKTKEHAVLYGNLSKFFH